MHSAPECSIIDPNDPRLISDLWDGIWQPPIPWEQSDNSRDQREWIEAMAAYGLRSKATAAFSCGDRFVPVLHIPGHAVGLGRATCQVKTCRPCGNGKMRVHRVYRANPARYQAITSQPVRTLRLVIAYSAPSPTLDVYVTRILSAKRYLAALRRRMRREFSGDFGWMMSVEFDPHRQDVIFRLFYVGYDPRANWFRGVWQRIVGLQGSCESKWWNADSAGDALRWTLDSIALILLLPGKERAAWEAAMQGHRFTSCIGCLRGIEKYADRPLEGDAPYGYCPCGCGKALQKADSRTPNSRTHFDDLYPIVFLCSLSTYTPHRPKVNAARAYVGDWGPLDGAPQHSPPS